MNHRVRLLYLLAAILWLPAAAQGVVVFQDDFSTDPNYNGKWEVFRDIGDMANEVSWEGSTEVTYLTRVTPNRAGAMFARYDLRSPHWTASFRFRVGEGTGADGLVFMFFKDREDYQPPEGSNMGFLGAGYAVEFDSHRNFMPADPSDNHIALIQDGVDNHLAWTPDLRVEDGSWHDCIVLYDHGQVTIDVDGMPALTHTLVAPDMTYTGIGFAAGTGVLTHNHMIDDFILDELEPGPTPVVSPTPVSPTPTPTISPTPVVTFIMEAGIQDPICNETLGEMPVGTFWNFSASQYCLGPLTMPSTYGLITELEWYDCTGGSGLDRSIELWLGTDPLPCGDYGYSSSWHEDLTRVYVGTLVQDDVPGWKTVILDHPFLYTQGQSLVVQVCDHTGSWSVDPAAWAASPAEATPHAVLGYEDELDHCDDWLSWTYVWSSLQYPSTRFVAIPYDGVTPTPAPSRTPTPTPVLACQGDALVSQPGHNRNEEYWGVPSDPSLGYTAFDNFRSVGEPICELIWFGVELDAGSDWAPCSKTVLFDIAFFEDDGGLPGTLSANYIASPFKVDTGLTYFGAPLYVYYHELPDPCFSSLDTGWFGVRAREDPAQPDCSFVWLSSPHGDGQSSYAVDTFLYPLEGDLAFCLGPAEAPPPVPALGGIGIGLLGLILGGLLAYQRRRR